MNEETTAERIARGERLSMLLAYDAARTGKRWAGNIPKRAANAKQQRKDARNNRTRNGAR